MTELSDLTPDDQLILTRTPNALVMATAYSEQDGVFSIRKELKAGLQAAIDGATAFPDNQIIQRLALDMNAIDQDEMDEVRQRASSATDPAGRVEERNPVASRPMALQLAGQSLAIMEAHATEQETIEFKYWLYSIADQVTLASKAGGFLGFGGTRVSPAEAAFLANLRQALDIPDDNVPSARESNTKIDDAPAQTALPNRERAEPTGVSGERPEDV